MGVGQANWPVIDISAVAQLVETVRAGLPIQLDQVTTRPKQALLGQVANFTGIWDRPDRRCLSTRGETPVHSRPSSASLRSKQDSTTRRTNEQNAWPTAIDVQDAYAGEDATVIQQVLDAHQTATAKRDAERNAWYDSQIVIAEAGEFLRSHRSHLFHAEQRNHPGARRTA